jgi:CheY-like chemotaxis protein
MRKILIVDDDVRLLSITRKVLETTALYEVQAEDSARRGLAVAATFKPELILLDMNMPGMSGVEFLRAISSPDGTLRYPVLVLTSRANMAQFFENIAVDGFMAKPCDPDELRTEVERILLLRRPVVPESAPDPAAAPKPKHILIGEDDRAVSRRLMEAFSQAGYAVECVSQGPEMLKKAIVQQPDVILVKFILTGLNGDAAARMLKELPSTRNIPVVLYDPRPSHADESTGSSPKPGVRKFVTSDRSQTLLSAVARVFS